MSVRYRQKWIVQGKKNLLSTLKKIKELKQMNVDPPKAL